MEGTKLEELEKKIEHLREKMYQAYNQQLDEEIILKISTQLDQLLNEQNRRISNNRVGD